MPPTFIPQNSINNARSKASAGFNRPSLSRYNPAERQRTELDKKAEFQQWLKSGNRTSKEIAEKYEQIFGKKLESNTPVPFIPVPSPAAVLPFIKKAIPYAKRFIPVVWNKVKGVIGNKEFWKNQGQKLIKGVVLGAKGIWWGVKKFWGWLKKQFTGDGDDMGWLDQLAIQKAKAGSELIRDFTPSLSEQVNVIVNGHSHSTKKNLFNLGIAIAFGQLPNNIPGFLPAFSLAVRYDMMGKRVEITLQYKYCGSITQTLGVVSGSLRDPIFASVDEFVAGQPPAGFWFGNSSIQKLFGINPSAGVNTNPMLPYCAGSNGNQPIAGPDGPSFRMIEPTPPGDGKARGTFLENLLYNTLARPTVLVPNGSGAPAIRSKVWDTTVGNTNTSSNYTANSSFINVTTFPKNPMFGTNPSNLPLVASTDPGNLSLRTDTSLQTGDTAQNRPTFTALDSISQNVINYMDFPYSNLFQNLAGYG